MPTAKEELWNPLADFLDSETARLDKARREQMDSRGYKEFWKPTKGVHLITLLAKIPRATKGQFGEKMAFRIYSKDDKTEYDWSVSPQSPLYRQLINALRNAKGKSTDIKVMKSGEGIGTRWELV
jgi:hypothetical protein